jgi:hypothetical protein
MTDGIQDMAGFAAKEREVSTIAADLDPRGTLPPVEVIPEEKPLRDWETCAIGQIPIKERIGVGVLNPDNVSQARWMAQTMAERAGTETPVINQVRVFVDGNMTIAIINDKITGWSKFNPNDVITVKGKSKKGKTWYQDKTKYSPEAGRMKAIHRAVEKLIDRKKNGSTGQVGQ